MTLSAKPWIRPPSTVLTVCLGNICRSPLAEQLLRARLTQSGLRNFEFLSAGLRAAVGVPMEPWPARLSKEYGGDPSGARGRQIGAEIVAASDLLLTMTLAQRNELLTRYPTAAQRTFTLAEFAGIVDALPHAPTQPSRAWPAATQEGLFSELSQVVKAAARARHLVPLSSNDDVRDPINQPEAVHREVAAQINELTNKVVSGLTRTRYLSLGGNTAEHGAAS